MHINQNKVYFFSFKPNLYNRNPTFSKINFARLMVRLYANQFNSFDGHEKLS